MHSSVAVGFRPAAAAAPEYKESNASEQRSNAPNDPRDADGRQDRGQNEGCDAQKNEQHADNDMNHLLPVLVPRGFDQESEIHSTISYASCATGVPQMSKDGKVSLSPNAKPCEFLLTGLYSFPLCGSPEGFPLAEGSEGRVLRHPYICMKNPELLCPGFSSFEKPFTPRSRRPRARRRRRSSHPG